MNALHAEAHWDFDGIWNAVATDPELWVGIITDPGERAIAGPRKPRPSANFKLPLVVLSMRCQLL
jgi:hypothetical protein